MSKIERLAQEIGRLDREAAGLLGQALLRALGIRLPDPPSPPKPPEPPPIDEPVLVMVWLDAYDPAARVPLIREVRGFLSLGLMESRNFVDRLPQALARDVAPDEAERIRGLFSKAGGIVRLT